MGEPRDASATPDLALHDLARPDLSFDMPESEDMGGVDMEARPVRERPELVWQKVGQYPLDESGRTRAFTITPGERERFVSVRVRPIWSEVEPRRTRACYQVEEAIADEVSWVEEASLGEVCEACTHRVRRTPFHGIYTFPNDGEALAAHDEISLRMGARDCATGFLLGGASAEDAPDELLVEVATEQRPRAPSSKGRLAIRVGIAPNTFRDVEDLLTETAWEEATSLLAARFAREGIEVAFEHTAMLSRSTLDPLVYGPEAHDDLRLTGERALPDLDAASATTRYIPIILVPCLILSQAGEQDRARAGTVPYIPGGSMTRGAGADAVFLTVGDCGVTERPIFDDVWRSAARLELLLSHEIGHYLGLHHADMGSGGHLLEQGQRADENIMVSTIAGVTDTARATFSRAQWRVMRQSALVWHID